MLSTDHVLINPFVAAVDCDRCEGLGLCVEQCEYGALKMVEMRVDGQDVPRVEVNPGLCVGCGACVPVCPHRAIQVQGWTLEQYEGMVEGLVDAATGKTPAAVGQGEDS